jgi:hypothetical protein
VKKFSEKKLKEAKDQYEFFFCPFCPWCSKKARSQERRMDSREKELRKEIKLWEQVLQVLGVSNGVSN